MSTQDDRYKKTSQADIDRRADSRLEVLERIQGELRALDTPVTLLNLSYGGFLMQTPVDFTIGGSHDFRFTSGLETPIMLRARVVHTMRATAAGVRMYVVGLEFEDQETLEFKQAIESLVRWLHR